MCGYSASLVSFYIKLYDFKASLRLLVSSSLVTITSLSNLYFTG